MTNQLYIGDNLETLRGLDSETVDLIYLDPPFNSDRNYHGSSTAAKAEFSDVWSWSEEVKKHELDQLVGEYPNLVGHIRSSRVNHSDGMAGYLLFMTVRIIELHRVLKPTGSLYLHCDSTASHYLKVVLDRVFGSENFRNEIVWQRTKGNKSSTRQLGRNTDTIFFYGKTDAAKFKQPYGAANEEYIRKAYRHDDGDGRGKYCTENLANPKPGGYMYDYRGYRHPANGWRCPESTMERLDAEGLLAFPKTEGGRIRRKKYLSDYRGTPLDNNWTDIGALQGKDKERTGWPTQKPLALLRRIIEASSNEGDLVLDPFAGCGTATIAAEQLGRRWIGCDIDEECPDMMRLLRERVELPVADGYTVHTGTPPSRSDVRYMKPRDSLGELYGIQRGKCNGCGSHKVADDMDVDHIIPRSKGGGDYFENYQLLCRKCNNIKRDKPMAYLLAKLEMLKDAALATEF